MSYSSLAEDVLQTSASEGRTSTLIIGRSAPRPSSREKQNDGNNSAWLERSDSLNYRERAPRDMSDVLQDAEVFLSKVEDETALLTADFNNIRQQNMNHKRRIMELQGSFVEARHRIDTIRSTKTRRLSSLEQYPNADHPRFTQIADDIAEDSNC